jgi:hypothetical protein
MTCREITERLDRGVRPDGVVDSVRVYAHYFVCKACRHYRAFTVLLRREVRPILLSEMSHSETDRFNRALLQNIRSKM